MAVRSLATTIDSKLRAAADPVRAVKEKAYLKSDLEHCGVTVPRIRSIVKAAVADRALDHAGLVTAVEELWGLSVHECRMASVALLELRGDLLVPADLPLLERLIREARTWALVDGLAASVTGPLVERCPKLTRELDRWAVDPDFWVRRSALLALLLPLRRGDGDFERFGRYADGMLGEKELFIRKAIGWVLRDTSRKRPELVVAWVRPRLGRMSGVTFREAVRRLPPEQSDELVAARSAG